MRSIFLKGGEVRRLSHGGRAIVIVALFVLCSLWASPAFAFNEVNNVDVMLFGDANQLPVRTSCASCHGGNYGGGTPDLWGVHGGYIATSAKCVQCHDLHDAPSPELLPGATVTATCNVCHDGTGGEGVYNVIQSATSVAPQGLHRTEMTSEVPGGSSLTGGSAAMVFTGEGTTLTCTDCHSPHGNNLVTAFRGDRIRSDMSSLTPPVSAKLLKQKPGGWATAVTEYGSDWCLACHQGRASGLATTHNHPVETGATIVYRSLPILSGLGPTSTTVTGALGGSNRGYLMPFPRTTGAGGQNGYDPICQQCHEDTRNVGTLSVAGVATAAPWQVSAPLWTQPDGTRNPTDNPRFQTFPHEGLNDGFLVEEYDNLCINCHSQSQIN